MALISGDRIVASTLTEGERWTRSALADLRARRYSPLGWARFIGASARRSAADLARRPDLVVQVSLVSAGGAAAWLATGRRWPLSWWGAVAGMLVTHVGMIEGPSGERRAGLGAANLLTLARAWLVPAVLMAGGRRRVSVITLAAFATDAIDGPIARRRGEVTRLGAQMDHAVDAALIVAVAEGARRRGWLSGRLTWLVGMRYAVPIALVAAHYFWRAEAPPRQSPAPARAAGVLLATGLVAASTGMQRLPAALVPVGAVWGAAVTATSSARALLVGPP